MGNLRRPLRAAWPVIACLLAGLASAAPAGAAEFCELRKVHDYLKRVERMPDLPSLPIHGRPAFKPRGVFIRSIRGTEQLQMGTGPVGYVISYGTPSPRLDWLVTSKLATVDRDGQVEQLFRAKQREIRRPGPGSHTDLSFEIADRPDIYRVDLTIRTLSGKLLGRFGKYVRVVRRSLDARLTLAANTYRPSEVLAAQVENYGTALVTYGVPYSIEKYDGATWSLAPESPKGPWIMPLLSSAPGYSGRDCLRFHIPETMPAGTYRVVKEVDYQVDLSGKERPAVLTAEFQIAP